MKRRIGVFVLATILGVTASSRAENRNKRNDPVATLEEVVVTGTRTEQRVEKVPAHVSVITEDQIRASGAQSVPEVLRGLGGVIVRDMNGNGNNQNIDMGGFGETADRHVAVVINGRRINPIDQSGIRWSTIPLENIQRIEILYGSGNVLYGDNAMGGVINIITKDWEGESGAHAELATGSHNTRKGHVNVAFGKEDVGVMLGATLFKTDGYRDRSERDQAHFYNKIDCYISDTSSLFFETNVSRASFQLPGPLTEARRDANRKQAANLDDEGKDTEASFAAGVEKDWGESGRLNLSLSHRRQDLDSDMASWWSFMKYDMETNGLTSKYVLERPLAERDNRLTLGLDLYHTAYDAAGGGFKGATTNVYDHSKRSVGGYAQDEFNIRESLLLNLGVRYEKPKTRLGADLGGSLTQEELDEGEWAWNVGLAWSFMPRSKVYARVYRSFRYPAVDEYTNLFTGEVNTTLKQETARGYEAGIRLVTAPEWSLNARVYWMDLKDEISWNNVTSQNENLEETRHVGGEFDVRYRLRDVLAFYGGGGYTRAEFTRGTNDGKSIPLVPEWKANAGLEILAVPGCRFKIQYNYFGKRYFGNDYSNGRKEMAAFHTVDLYASYRVNKMLEVFLNADNIFGEEYSDYGYYNDWDGTYNYYPMPEAVLFGGVRLTF